MNIKRRLILSNTITIIIPFVITAIAAFLFLFISTAIFNKDVSYDSFKKFMSVKTELANTKSSIWAEGSGNIEDAQFQQHLYQKLHSINGELIILKNNAVIFASKEVNKIDIEKCLIEAKAATSKNIVKIDNADYMVEVAPLSFKDGALGDAILLAPTFEYSGILQKFIIFIFVVFLMTFIAVLRNRKEKILNIQMSKFL